MARFHQRPSRPKGRFSAVASALIAVGRVLAYFRVTQIAAWITAVVALPYAILHHFSYYNAFGLHDAVWNVILFKARTPQEWIVGGALVVGSACEAIKLIARIIAETGRMTGRTWTASKRLWAVAKAAWNIPEASLRQECDFEDMRAQLEKLSQRVSQIEQRPLPPSDRPAGGKTRPIGGKKRRYPSPGGAVGRRR
jgi:hypothetical protein